MKSLKLKILLDTTYLLPALGVKVDIEPQIFEILKQLYISRHAEFYYTSLNILEALGKIAKTKYDINVVSIGLESIKNNLKLLTPTVKDYLKALELRSKGFRDL